jgi:putative endonuclease
MTDKIKKGLEGEKLAAEFLAKNGFEIIERNYRYKHSEIDLIVRKDKWLIFVEVKTRTSISFGYPEEFVDYNKVKSILRGAEEYMYKIDWAHNVRFDVVSVLMMDGKTDIAHFEDAFY